jgi:hypothetical protein
MRLLGLDAVNLLGPDRFVVRRVNRAVNKVSAKNRRDRGPREGLSGFQDIRS